MAIERRLEGLELSRAAAADGLDRLPTGVVFLDRSGRVCHMNAAARAVIDARDGLQVGRDGLVAARDDESRALRALIGVACGAAGGVAARGGPLALSRPSGKRPLALLVTPIRLPTPSGRRDAPAALVFVGDPERRDEPSAALMRRLYGLTPAEAALTARLLAGMSLEEAAAARGVSTGTARMQLKAIFGKTGVRRQAELVGTLLRGIAQIRED